MATTTCTDADVMPAGLVFDTLGPVVPGTDDKSGRCATDWRPIGTRKPLRVCQSTGWKSLCDACERIPVATGCPAGQSETGITFAPAVAGDHGTVQPGTCNSGYTGTGTSISRYCGVDNVWHMSCDTCVASAGVQGRSSRSGSRGVDSDEDAASESSTARDSDWDNRQTKSRKRWWSFMTIVILLIVIVLVVLAAITWKSVRDVEREVMGGPLDINAYA